ncbi:MAG: prepilin-type N-terminal cleavage/methylation domain-containing protein [Candidatus Omnitrophica bacterium]|nr:prepilin-type N-terminal cleavage/methylation domain-containing protein [Candidatus Omnitrophota bacterium]
MISETGNNDNPRSGDAGCDTTRRGSGFTLIELLSVVVILAMLIAAAVPVLNKTSRNFYFRNRVKQIEMLFGTLQKTAVMEERAYKLTIDFTQNRLSVWNAQDKPEEGFRLSRDVLLNAVRLGQGIAMSAATGDTSNGTIFFAPDGTITPSALSITDNRNNSARLSTTLSGEIDLEFL